VPALRRPVAAGLLVLALASSGSGADSKAGRQEPGGLSVAGCVHVQWGYDFRGLATPRHGFSLRRGRVEFQYDAEKVGAELELGCDKLRLSVKDAWAEYRPDPRLRFVAGLRKMGFSAEELTPASRLVMIERSRTNDVMAGLGYLGRDIGLAVEGEWLKRPVRLGYALGAFNGNGDRSGRDWNDAKQFCERLTVVLLDRLWFGVNATQRNDSLTGRLQVAVGGDVRYRFRQLTIEAEVLAGDAGPEARMLAGFVVGAYRLGAFEPGLRLERLSEDLADRESCTTVLTLACNWYLHRRASVKVNLVTDVPAGGSLGHEAVLQAQVSF